MLGSTRNKKAGRSDAKYGHIIKIIINILCLPMSDTFLNKHVQYFY